MLIESLEKLEWSFFELETAANRLDAATFDAAAYLTAALHDDNCKLYEDEISARLQHVIGTINAAVATLEALKDLDEVRRASAVKT
jgi:adenosylcobinamide amidohydrolase